MCRIFWLAGCSVFVVVMSALAGDPYDYKELVTSASHPEEIREGLFDFGKDGIGWLELHGVEPGLYKVTMGELTNAEGHVANPYTNSTIRCQTLEWWVSKKVQRLLMPADPWNLIGYDMEHAPAVSLPRWAQIVFPFRYVEIVKAAGNVEGRHLVRKMLHYPIDMKQSSFACDNGILNEIYEFCKYSILATSFCGCYVDGDRERTPYEGDAYINQLCQYAIDADYSLGRKSHEWLMEHPTWPTEWKQHSIKMAWADWMWTGDTRSLEKYYDRLQGKLIGSYRRFDIVDWPEKERDGFVMKESNAVVEAFHCQNLKEMSDIATAIGKTADAAEYLRRYGAARQAFVRDFLDPGTGLFVDASGESHSSLHANAAALAFGLVPENRVPVVVAFLTGKGLACSVYFSQYLLEGLCVAGRADVAIRLMSSTGKRSWKGMMDFGSTITMEAWNPEVKPNLDLNHAWGAVPLNIISRYVLGVTPASAGFARICVKPQVGDLKRVVGTVPTARGPVHVSIAGSRLTVDVPAPAVVVWKGLSHEVQAGESVFD